MSEVEVLKRLKSCIVELDVSNVKETFQAVVDAGIPQRIILDEISKAMEEVGSRFEKGEYFLSELIMAAEIMKEGMEVLAPYLGQGEAKVMGKVVIGTVSGDIHDIGKNIVITLLKSAGFQIYDLGVDVPPEDFVRKVKETGAEILGLSALLPITMEGMREVIDALKKEGIRNQVKVIVGGAPLTEEFARSIGADAYAKDAIQGVEICKRWVQKLNSKL